jgi:hypothetical protein
MPNRFLARLPIERILIFVSVILGALHAWAGRTAMNPDGISYLDVGNSFFRHDWANALNAWWSPLYAWTLGIVVGLFNPTSAKEFPLVHLMNFCIFLFALFTFRYLLHSFPSFRPEPPASPNAPGRPLPAWLLVLLGYPTFLWIALEVETVYDVSPDLAVMACFCLSCGLLLRLRNDGPFWTFVLFGFVLGFGYWTKAILFPLGVGTLVLAYLWKRKRSGWARRILVAGLVFLFTCSPLIFLLSQQKGRFTFGDSGKTNYAWYISPRTFWRNWQGKEIGSGTPKHATRQLLDHPPLYEFDGPVVGTYPPWTDPSYWNDGLKWHFKLKPQIEVLMGTIPSVIRLFFRSRPELAAGVIILVLLSGRLWWTGLVELWPLLAISILGIGLYVPILENDRYLGGFILVLFLSVLVSVRLSSEENSAAWVSIAVFVIMALGTADYSVRILTNHLAIPGDGPNSTLTDLKAAEQLGQMGLNPGDKIAVILDGTGAYWAHLAKLRIVAEIMDTFHGSREFWNAAPEVQQHVFELFRGAHAKAVVTNCPACPPGIPLGWESIQGTPYCVRSLD